MTQVNRAGFLRAGAGALAVASLRWPARRASAREPVDVTLRSAPLRDGLAYNGTIPGPLLRVAHGQRIRVRYVSGVEVPTSVHWHGLLLPNDMDGVAGLTQAAVHRGGEYVYDFVAGPSGTRWYHDHAFQLGMARGLFGMFVVEDPNEEAADAEFALVFHDVPVWSSIEAALRGMGTAPMSDPMGSPEIMQMAGGKMGDEVAYAAHCINGASYPNVKKLAVRLGQRVRLRLLNASPTLTRYVRLAGHSLTVTHADGNALAAPVEVDALRIATGERYDAIIVVRDPGAFLLEGVGGDPLASQQALVVCTEGMENAPPLRASPMLEGARVFSYELAGGIAAAAHAVPPDFEMTLGGGGWKNPRWTIDDRVWPQTPKLRVRRGQVVTLRFRNTSEMDHPMHLHGHIFALTEVDGKSLLRPLSKDVVLVAANGGTVTWRFVADAPAGRWLLHCHNEVHMVDGMMSELVYVS